jgi:hypothetical protein
MAMASKVNPGVILKAVGYGVMDRHLPNETSDKIAKLLNNTNFRIHHWRSWARLTYKKQLWLLGWRCSDCSGCNECGESRRIRGDIQIREIPLTRSVWSCGVNRQTRQYRCWASPNSRLLSQSHCSQLFYHWTDNQFPQSPQDGLECKFETLCIEISGRSGQQEF